MGNDVKSGPQDRGQHHKYPPLPSLAELGLIDPNAPKKRRSGSELPKMKKFRFQLLSAWIAESFPACRVGDVGGGKGLLSFLLDRAGFECTVIDPHPQPLPDKFRDLVSDKQIRLGAKDEVRRVVAPFEQKLGEPYDLLIGLHAHGTNIAILDTVRDAQSSCVLLPCCVIDEPATPPIGKNWFVWLLELAKQRGLEAHPFYLNFSGQNVGFYVRGRRPAAQEGR